MTDGARVRAALGELAELARTVAGTLPDEITAYAVLARSTIESGGKLLFCGNGGSAADAQHLAAEYVVRLARDRRTFPALALTTDSSVLMSTAQTRPSLSRNASMAAKLRSQKIPSTSTRYGQRAPPTSTTSVSSSSTMKLRTLRSLKQVERTSQAGRFALSAVLAQPKTRKLTAMTKD